MGIWLLEGLPGTTVHENKKNKKNCCELATLARSNANRDDLPVANPYHFAFRFGGLAGYG